MDDNQTVIVRNLASSVLAALADTRVVFLNGARQAGKSTLARWLMNNGFPAKYLTLDSSGVLAAVSRDPSGFLSGMDEPLILDEIQRAPALCLAIKCRVDRDPRPGQFLLTGSANVMLLPRVADLLAGRMEILTLRPFSQGEMAGVQEDFIDRLFGEGPLRIAAGGVNKHDMLARILRGGYPALMSRDTPERRRAWFGSYINTILQRDIRDLANIEGLVDVPRLLALIASRATSLLNFAALSRDAALPQTTLKRYMALLETAFLVERLPAWSPNIGRRFMKSPKIYLGDAGLLAYLLGIDERRLSAYPDITGPLVENFVLTELLKQAAWSATKPAFYHFRSLAGQEVDIVLEEPAGAVVGVEVKASETIQAADFKGLKLLAEVSGARFRRGIVVYLGAEHIPFGPALHAVPVDTLWRPARR